MVRFRYICATSGPCAPRLDLRRQRGADDDELDDGLNDGLYEELDEELDDMSKNCMEIPNKKIPLATQVQ